MKNIALSFLLICQSLLVWGQISGWEIYTSLSRGQNMLEEENTLWLPTDAGLLEIDKETADYTLWNRGNGGLSSNSIEAVARNPITGDLFIGTYDVALMVREETGGGWSPLPYPEEWETSSSQPLLTYCLEFDAEGILWAGTSRGLARYDGEHWELYNQENTHEFLSWVKGIEKAPDGGIYVASHVLFHVKDGEFTPLSPSDFQSENFIFSYGDGVMHYHSDGSLWFFTDVGSFGRYENGEWEVFDRIDSLNFLPSPPQFVTESPEGKMLAYFGADSWYEYAGGNWSAGSAPHGFEAPLFFSFIEGGDIIVNKEKMMLKTSGGVRTAAFPDYPFSTQLYYFNYNPQGQLWAKEGNQLRNLDTGELLNLEAEGAPVYFSSYAFTAGGDLWATQHGAVFHLANGEWERFDHTNTLLPDATNSWQVAVGEGNTIWVCIYNQGLFSYRNGLWKKHVQPLFSAFNISRMIPLPDGKLWMNLWSLGVSSRIGWWDGQSANLLSDGEEGFRLADGQQLSYDPASGRLWALDWGGLQQYDGQAWTPVEFPFEQDTTQFEYIYTFSARNNRIVIATNLRIFIYENEEWFTYSSANAPLANEDIREVAMTQSRKLWVLHQSTSNIEVGQWSLASGASPESKTHQVKKAFVYPNPVEEKAFIDGISGNGEGLIQLFDAQGRLARSMQATFSEGQPSEITRLNLPPGFYTGRVFLNGEVYVFKLVKRN